MWHKNVFHFSIQLLFTTFHNPKKNLVCHILNAQENAGMMFENVSQFSPQVEMYQEIW